MLDIFIALSLDVLFHQPNQIQCSKYGPILLLPFPTTHGANCVMALVQDLATALRHFSHSSLDMPYNVFIVKDLLSLIGELFFCIFHSGWVDH